MAINGQQNLNIGAENQAAGSDNLFDAFTKVQNNFTTLFNSSSPYNTFTGNGGITAYANSTTGVVTITNTGVISLTEGTGIALSGSNGNIVISAIGDGPTGVTSVGLTSNSSTITINDGPIVSAGNINVDLPVMVSDNYAAGDYIAPTVTVDNYGRITSIANTAGVGTVTSVALEVSGDGLEVTNSPITTDGVLTITNTGVTSIQAGTGIDISGSTGAITISSLNVNQGTVTRIDVTSNNLTVTGSPITNSGEITVDLPDDVTVTGNIVANIITANITLESAGNLSVTGNANIGNVGATGFYGNLTGDSLGAHNGTIGATTPNAGAFTNVTASGNVTGTNIYGANIIANGVGSFVQFANAAGNYTRFVTPTNISNSAYYVPNTSGTVHQLMGVTATGATNTLGWKTIPVQYVTVSPRSGSSFTAPFTPVLRVFPLSTRAGYINITLS
jgi:hypothetical protein